MQDDFELLSEEKTMLENELYQLKGTEVGKILVPNNVLEYLNGAYYFREEIKEIFKCLIKCF